MHTQVVNTYGRFYGENTSLKEIMPSWFLKKQNLYSNKGFVRILANWFFKSTKFKIKYQLSTLPQIKWCFISICLALE